MGAVDLVIQVESPGAVARGLQRIGRAGHQVGEPSTGKLFPKHRADLRRGGGRRRSACTTGSIEHTRYPAQPARRAGPADRRACARSTSGRSPTSTAMVRRAAPFAELADEVLRRRARPAGRSLPVRGVRRAAAAHRVGPRRRHGPRPSRAPSGWRSPTAAPSPTVACSACSSPTAPGSASSTRRWSTRAGPARRSCSAPPPGASRTSPTSGSSSRRRRASPARCRSGTATAPAVRSSWARRIGEFVREIRAAARRRGRSPGCETATTSTRWAADEPARLPRRAGRGHRRGARRSHHRRRAVPRRDRRLADLRALAVRRPGPRAVGDGAASPAGRALGHGRRADVERRRHRVAPARGRRRAAHRRAAHRPRRDRRAHRQPAARTRPCSPAGSGSARLGRCCCRAAAPTAARRCGSSARRRPTCWRWRPSTRASRSCSRRPASAATTCSTCRRCGRCSPTCGRRKVRMVAVDTDAGLARSPSRCCSAGSPSTCTRATRRWPSGGPRRWRSTATCCASCSAPRSCASCSTPRCSADLEARAPAPRRPTGWPAMPTRSHDLLRACSVR